MSQVSDESIENEVNNTAAFKGKYTKFIFMSICAFIFYLTPMLFNFTINEPVKV